VFGLTVNLWTPLYHGMTVVSYANPLEYQKICQIIREGKPTVMAATPSFWWGYLKKSEKDLYGVLTVRDIVHNVLGKNLDMKKTKVGEVATKRVVCVNKETELQDFIQLMEKFNIGRVFVNEGKDIIGVASLFDIINFFLTKEK